MTSIFICVTAITLSWHIAWPFPEEIVETSSNIEWPVLGEIGLKSYLMVRRPLESEVVSPQIQLTGRVACGCSRFDNTISSIIMVS
jgi:hypothetical protein